MAYWITHTNHPDLVDASKGLDSVKYSTLIDNFYDKENHTFHFPFPLDSLLKGHFEEYHSPKEVYMIALLIKRRLYSIQHAYGERLKEEFSKIKAILHDLSFYLKKENQLIVLDTIFLHLLNNAHNYSFEYINIFLETGMIDLNKTFSFNPYSFLEDSNVFGYTPLMVAKSKKYMQLLVEHGAKLDLLANPISYYSQYEQYFKNQSFGFYQKTGKPTYTKREGKTALEIAILDKKKYAIDLLKAKMNEAQESMAVSVDDIFEKNYQKIVATKKTVSRFNLAIREVKASNPILLSHIEEAQFEDILSFVDKNQRDFLSYAIKYRSNTYLKKLISMPSIYQQAQTKEFKLNTHHEYINDALINGNKDSVRLLFEHHFYHKKGKPLFHAMVYGNLPDLAEQVYLNDSSAFCLEAMMKPNYYPFLIKVLKDGHVSEADMKEAIMNLSLAFMNQSIQQPMYIHFKLDNKFYKSFFTLLHAYSQEKIVDTFMEGLIFHKKTRQFSEKYLDGVQHTLFEFFTHLINEFPMLEKEAFYKLKDFYTDNPYFIAQEKHYLEVLFQNTDDNEKGEGKKGRNKI